ncbi:hypothetical protein PFISCL1PPCAC_9997, partial [Pristionchus fissidentatus]
ISVSFIFLLFSSFTDSPLDPCANSKPANQTLHGLINTLPVQRLIVTSPSLNAAASYEIVLLVVSAIYEREERAEIRRLWADKEQSEMLNKSRVIFLVGRGSAVMEEARDHEDILQVDVDETYRNMVYKIESGFRWVREKVKSRFVAKIDSDTVVHIDRLFEQLQRVEKESSGDWLACFKFVHAPPIRDECSPWFISSSDYSLDSFSSYCGGPGYVMRRSAFEKIVDTMKDHKVRGFVSDQAVVEVEDAFFTAVVAADTVNLVCLQDVIVERY